MNDSSSAGGRVVVLDGSALGNQTSKGFESIDAAESHIVSRVRAHTLPDMLPRFERAIADRIVSEDGTKATSEVIAGKFAFLQALAKAYASSRVAIATSRPSADDSDDR